MNHCSINDSNHDFINLLFQCETIKNNLKIQPNNSDHEPELVSSYYKNLNKFVIVQIDLQLKTRNLSNNPNSAVNNHKITQLFEQLIDIKNRCQSRKNLSNQDFLEPWMQNQIKEDDLSFVKITDKIIEKMEKYISLINSNYVDDITDA